MKTRTQIALVFTFLSILAHLYLTLHYYPLKFGISAEQSICSVSSKFDCDAVSASAYSSFLSIPLSVWGAVINTVLFLLILFGWLEWSEYPERLRRWAVGLSGLSVVGSIGMGIISLLFMHSYCLFCIALYVFSFIIFFTYAGVLREPFWSGFKRDLPLMWSESRGVLVAFAAVPVGALLVHQIFMQNLGADQIDKMIRDSVRDWESAPRQEFVAKPALTMGAPIESAAMTLVEFADFRCSHCKRASITLHAFARSHPDVRFEFYAYPLDGACNDKVQGSTGISCRLAGTVVCAEKEGKGWEMHDAIFKIQERVNQSASVTEVDTMVAEQVAQLGLNWPSIQHCLSDPATTDAVKAQAKQGSLVGVNATPTMFANGKHLPRGQLVPVLQEARRKLLEAKK